MASRRHTSVRTLDELIIRLSSDACLAAWKKRRLRCCINRLSDLCGLAPNRIAADPRTIRLLLNRCLDSREDLTHRRLAEIRAGLGLALRLAGLGEGRRPPATADLRADYKRLLAAIEQPFVRLGLVRFFRFCSARGIRVTDVDQRTFDAFRDHLERRTLLPNPSRTAHGTLKTWNKCAETVRGWPRIKFSEGPSCQMAGRTPLPDGLLAEVERYRMFLMGRGPSPSGQYRSRPCTQSTATLLCRTIVRLARLLAQAGVPPTSCNAIVGPDNVARILHVLRIAKVRRQRIYVQALMLRQMARTWCAVPQGDLRQLQRLINKYTPPFRPGAARSRQLSSLLFDARRRNLLISLPDRLLAQASASGYSRRRRALMAQAAAAFEIALMAPIFPNELARLKLGTTLLKEAGEPASYRITIPASENGRRTELSYVLPPTSSRLIACYINEFRGMLCGPSTAWLFPGNGDNPKIPSALSSQVTAYIRHFTRMHVTLLGVRYFVGAMYLLKYPGTHEVVRQALGHKSLHSTRLMYRDLDALTASDRFDRVVLGRAGAEAPA